MFTYSKDDFDESFDDILNSVNGMLLHAKADNVVDVDVINKKGEEIVKYSDEEYLKQRH